MINIAAITVPKTTITKQPKRKKKEKEDALANNIMLVGQEGCGQNAIVFDNEEEMNEDGNVSNEESDD